MLPISTDPSVPKHLLGRTLVCGFDGLSVPPEIRGLIAEWHISGVILFRRNIASPEQLMALTTELQALAGYPLFIAIDQEGGRVLRLPEPFTQFPSFRVYGDYLQRGGDLQKIRAVACAMGTELAAVGINWNLVPVLDVDSNPANPIIGDRSPAADPLIVARVGEAFLHGLHDVGIMACGKHFPGHGATSQDSHLVLPVDARPWEEIVAKDLVPFRHLIAAGLEAIMTAHVVYPGIDKQLPATLSRPWLTEKLRGALGFGGLVVSDDLLMKAIDDGLDLSEKFLAFLRSGGDIALCCRSPERALALLASVWQKIAGDELFAARLQQIGAKLAALFSGRPCPTQSRGWPSQGFPAHHRLLACLR